MRKTRKKASRNDGPQNVRAATEGETFTAAGLDEPVRVGPKCDTNKGNWFCGSCDEGFTNQLMKDCHITRGTHVLVWVCFEHGAETP